MRKGISGAGLFKDQGRLIGLNATQADRLWSAPLRAEGQLLPAQHTGQLARLALAIPLSGLQPLLADLVPPQRSHPWPCWAGGLAAAGDLFKIYMVSNQLWQRASSFWSSWSSSPWIRCLDGCQWG